MAQQHWANAGHATSPDATGPVATQHDVEAQHTTKYHRDQERARALAERLDTDAAVPSLKRRRAASYRLPSLACGHRDPMDCLASEGPFVVGPCRYGLTIEQAKRHANELVTTWGWSVEEVVEALGVEPKAA